MLTISGKSLLHFGDASRLLCGFTFLVFAHCLPGPQAQESKEVIGEGRANGSSTDARELALTSALRDAVERGAGVNLISQTQVNDYELEYDRVFASAFGYIQTYHVLSSQLGKDGLYRVQVRAMVKPGQPELKDELCLRQLVRLQQAPRVVIELIEWMEGVPPGSDFARSWLEEAALKMQLNIQDVRVVRLNQDQAAAWAEYLGRRQEAVVRRGRFTSDADLVIRVMLRGRHLGQKTAYGIPFHQFSLTGDLKVYYPDDGAIVVAVSLPGSEEFRSEMEDVQTAAREQIHKYLDGGRMTEAAPGAWMMFRRLFAQWATGLAMGRMVSLECFSMNSPNWHQLITNLNSTAGFSAIYPRQFVPDGVSKLHLETRLSLAAVIPLIEKVIGKGYRILVATPHSVRVAPRATPGPPEWNPTPRLPSSLLGGGIGSWGRRLCYGAAALLAIAVVRWAISRHKYLKWLESRPHSR